MSESHGLLKTDPESQRSDVDGRPIHIQHILKKGAGQYEEQGFEDWTPEEQKMWSEGTLKRKIGVGQVSLRLPVQSAAQFIALVYGFLPFIIPIWWIIWAIVSKVRTGHARFFPVFGLSIAIGFALANELVTKQICKRVLPASITDRPPEAVCKHPGMPSGHVMNAFTLMVWCLLEASMDDHVHPEWLLIVVLTMGPVPWARVFNKDHTVAQVCVSAFAACINGSIAFYIRKTRYPRMDQPWDDYALNDGVVNPYRPKFL